MNYATIKWHDISNGPGVRVSLYVSGCRNRCKNCFNPETWDFNYGKEFTKEVQDSIINALEPEHIKGFSLLGGDPFEPENQIALLPFMERVKSIYSDKPIWAWSGYTFEDMVGGKRGDKQVCLKLLSLIDVLVDGRYVEEQNDIKLRFKGSHNQRTILVKQSIEQGKIILWDEQSQL